MKIKAVGFDFDGTLIMSEKTKAKEMAVVFKEKFNIKKGVITAYKSLSGTGKNRDEKVKALFTKFLKRKPTKKELSIVAKHFGKHYERSLNTCPLFQCSNIIKELKEQVKFIFMLSLEDKKEITKVAKHCGVAKDFDEILGGPKAKIVNLNHVIKKHKLKPKEVLYIGDAHSDVVASRKTKVKIILLGRKHLAGKLKQDLQADFVFSSLCKIPKSLNNLKKLNPKKKKEKTKPKQQKQE